MMLFDTFRYVKMMRDVGFTEDQSETIVDVWSTVVKDQFVTKQDLKQAFLEEREIVAKNFEEMNSKISKNISGIASLESSIRLLEKSMTIKFLLMQFSSVGIIIGALVFLPKIWTFLA